MPEAKERPILFNGPMVRAIVAGRKTVTRRAVKHRYEMLKKAPYFATGRVLSDLPGQPGAWMEHRYEGQADEAASFLVLCPYGQVGDRLWVREAWAQINVAQAPGESWVVYRECDNRTDFGGPWKPSIHMRRRDSRILLEITGVRVERLQAISADQALAEGVRRYDRHAEAGDWFHIEGIDDTYSADPVASFAQLWNSTGGDWDASPWVWVVEFKRIQPCV